MLISSLPAQVPSSVEYYVIKPNDKGADIPTLLETKLPPTIEVKERDHFSVNWLTRPKLRFFCGGTLINRWVIILQGWAPKNVAFGTQRSFAFF